jgi:hypothetical protein
MRRLFNSPRLDALGLGVGLAMAGALGACLVNADVDLGHNVDAGAPSAEAPTLDGTVAGDAGAALLSVAISATAGTICRGSCVSLVSAATGGTGPYSYSWGQGLGEGPGPKAVCPTATEAYSVIAGSSTGEEQSTASATITVIACDAGARPTPLFDAGTASADGGGTMCVPNPSFEGPTMIGSNGPPGVATTAAPPQWQVCLGTPDVDPALSLLPASDGKSYVGLAVGFMGPSNMTEAIGATLCAPVQAGVHYSFCLDLGIGVQGLMIPQGVVLPPVLQIWGGGSPCGQDELLWSSPPITNGDSWARVCGGFVPSETRTNVVLTPAEGGAMIGAGSWSYVIVDHLVAGP